MPKNPLVGSERKPLPGARSIGKADPGERLEVTLVLRHRQHERLQERVRKIAAGDKSERHLTHEEYDQQFGAELHGHPGCQTIRQSARSRRRRGARGAASTSCSPAPWLSSMTPLAWSWSNSSIPAGPIAAGPGQIHLPDELNGVVTAVLGLDNRPQARPHFRTLPTHGNVEWHAAAAASTSFTPTQLAALYNFPAGDRARRVHRHHRARRRLPHDRPQAYFTGFMSAAEGARRVGRRRQEPADRRPATGRTAR